MNNETENTRLAVMLPEETMQKLKSVMNDQRETFAKKGIKKDKDIMAILVQKGIDLLYGYEEVYEAMGKEKFDEVLEKKVKTLPQLF